MSNASKALVVAMAIYAKDPDNEFFPMEDLEAALYHAVEVCGFGHDELKADLYAQLAEKLTADTKFNDAVGIIADAMDATEKYYG